MTKDAKKLLKYIVDESKNQGSATIKIDIREIKNIPNLGFAKNKLLNELEIVGVISGYKENVFGEIFVYLTSDGLEYFDDSMEDKERSKILFNISGGQVNIASGNGKIDAFINEKCDKFKEMVKNEQNIDKGISLLSNEKEKKVFVSYSWTPQSNRRWVEQLVHRLEKDCVKVVVDFNDLRPGHDKYVFMERIVNDDSIKKVLIICNRTYKEKADGRVGGVGDESAIITSQVYGRVLQEKFIPIINEYDENGRPFLPNYLASRMYVDLTDFQRGYEELLRSILR